jgi:hypothetical protein
MDRGHVKMVVQKDMWIVEPVGPKRHTDKTGDISEAAIIACLLQVGYLVLMPYGKNQGAFLQGSFMSG